MPSYSAWRRFMVVLLRFIKIKTSPSRTSYPIQSWTTPQRSWFLCAYPSCRDIGNCIGIIQAEHGRITYEWVLIAAPDFHDCPDESWYRMEILLSCQQSDRMDDCYCDAGFEEWMYYQELYSDYWYSHDLDWTSFSNNESRMRNMLHSHRNHVSLNHWIVASHKQSGTLLYFIIRFMVFG